MITSNQNVIDIVQLPEISREEKQITVLSTNEVIIDDFISLKMSAKGSIYQRNMKYCEIVLNGKHELTSEWLNVKRFIASDIVDSGNLQEIDYGDFGVLKTEYDDTTQRTKLTCYDRMLQAQIPYDSEVMDLTYPMTISQVLNRLAIVCKLDLVVNTVNNLYQVIAVDLWANQSFTYADVLDHIAQATTSIIAIRNNKLEIFNPIENDFTIQGKFTSLKMGETFGKTNIVNVSQEPQHYNKYAPINALDIPLEDRKELAFSNNPILNQDMQTWADRLYLQTKDLEYATFESSTIGYGVFEIGDMVDVYEANEDIMHRVMITNETFDFKHALVTEIGSALPMVHKNQYVVETDQIRQGQTTYLIVDQLNGIIEALVQKVDDEADKTAQLRIDVDSITSTVENISNGNLLTNGSGELGFLGWSGGSVAKYVKEILEARTTDLRYLENLRYNMGFVPMYNPQSLSEWDISFYNNGFDVSTIAFIVPNIEHSYRAKVSKFKPFSIDVLEFDNSDKAIALTADEVTNFAFNNPMEYVQFTFTPSETTQFVRFKYNRTGITTSDRLNISEVMFNRGQPKEWQPSPNNAITYTRSSITQLSNEIELKVGENEVVSSINQSAETIAIKASKISLEGIITANGNVKIFEDGSIEVNKGKFKGEIDTDDRVRVGTYIGMPLVKVQNISEWVENGIIGKGGIFWSADGSNTNIGASIMVNEFIGSTSQFGKRMQLKADNISIIGEEGFQIMASGNVGNSFQISAGTNTDGMRISNYDSSISIWAETGFRADTNTGDMRLSSNGGNVMLFGDKLLVGLGGFKEVEFYLDSGGNVKWRNT